MEIKDDNSVVYITMKYEDAISVGIEYGFNDREIEVVMKLMECLDMNEKE